MYHLVEQEIIRLCDPKPLRIVAIMDGKFYSCTIFKMESLSYHPSESRCVIVLEFLRFWHYIVTYFQPGRIAGKIL